jgi:hypothetical protein
MKDGRLAYLIFAMRDFQSTISLIFMVGILGISELSHRKDFDYVNGFYRAQEIAAGVQESLLIEKLFWGSGACS